MRATLEASFRAALKDTDPYALTRAHLPDERSHAAVLEALDRVGRLSEEDLALVLVSGGGSALLSAP